MKNEFFVARGRSFSKQSESRFVTHCFLSNNSFKKIYTISSGGMLVNDEVTSRLAMKQLECC